MKGSKILIVEDESIIAEELRRIVSRLGYEVIGVLHRYTDTLDALKTKKPDLILLDIGLDYSDKDGIDLAKEINNKYKTPFIYITANADLATVQRAKKTKPASYILKPFNEQTIFTNIEIALHKEITPQSIIVKNGTHKVKLNCEKIIFLKADNIYTEIYTANMKKYVLRDTLKNVLNQLPESLFIQVHRSYIINRDFIQSHTNKYIVIRNERIPLSNSYKMDFIDFFNQIL